KDDALIVPAVAPHAMYTNDKATLLASVQLARRYGVPVIIHLAETENELKTAREKYQMTPTAYLESIGFWGPPSDRQNTHTISPPSAARVRSAWSVSSARSSPASARI